MQAFLTGAVFSAGFCSAATVFVLAGAAAVMVREKAMGRRRLGRVIHEAMSGLSEEDFTALMRGDETTGEGDF